jgi:hypothetical protein
MEGIVHTQRAQELWDAAILIASSLMEMGMPDRIKEIRLAKIDRSDEHTSAEYDLMVVVSSALAFEFTNRLLYLETEAQLDGPEEVHRAATEEALRLLGINSEFFVLNMVRNHGFDRQIWDNGVFDINLDVKFDDLRDLGYAVFDPSAKTFV